MARASAPDLTASLRAEAHEAAELADLRAANRRLQDQLRRAKASKEELVAAVRQAAYDAAITIGPPPVVPVPKISRTKLEPHTALIHTTDWQAGKKTPDFDIPTLEARLSLMMDKVQVLTDRHGHPVPDCTIMFGGDDIEGISIFPGQAFEVHAGLFEQVFAAVRLKRMVVDRALSMFKTVTVRRKWGNHGRIGKFGELPDVANLDLIADAFAAEAYKGHKRVTWHWQNVDYVQQFAIGNYHAALLHGNEFYRTFSAQRIVNKVTAWQTMYGFGDVYMGHFHRTDEYGLPNGTKIYLTGSPESSNAYAADHLAARSTPSQRLHYIDPQLGRVIDAHVLWLDQ